MAEPNYVTQNSLKRPLQYEPTRAYYKDHSEGDRYGASPNEEMRIAAYLPYIRFNTGVQAHEVALGGTFMSRDGNRGVTEGAGKLVPANGVPLGLTEYPGRPLFYADIDHDDANDLINFNPDTATLLVSGDLNADNIIVSASVVDGIEGMGYVGVQAGRYPIGALVETALEGRLDRKKINFDPQPQLTVITHYVLEFGEFTVNKRNYKQAVADAIQVVQDLSVGAPGALDPVGSKPDWVPAPAGTDQIESGDLIAIDDRGRPVRFEASALDQSADEDVPAAALNAIVGRCWATDAVLSLGSLNRVSTSPGARVVGGSRPDTANAGAQQHLEGASRRLLIKVELG